MDHRTSDLSRHSLLRALLVIPAVFLLWRGYGVRD